MRNNWSMTHCWPPRRIMVGACAILLFLRNSEVHASREPPAGSRHHLVELATQFADDLVEALGQPGLAVAGPRQVDVENAMDAARPRAHQHDAIGQEYGLGEAVGDE